MIDKIKALCQTVGVKPLIILRTSRAGEEVDNGMGVDFNLPEWALIYKASSGIDCITAELEFLRNEQKTNGSSFDLQKFDVDHCISLEGMVQELKERDDYDVVWRENL